MRRALTATVALLLLSGCAGVPVGLEGDDFVTSTPDEFREYQAQVRWGGVILDNWAEEDGTCFEILAQPLDQWARPNVSAPAQGRFIACADHFYEPFNYRQGRELTVVGALGNPRTHEIDDYEYRYPTVQIEALHLWRQRPLRFTGPSYYWGDRPWWGNSLSSHEPLGFRGDRTAVPTWRSGEARSANGESSDDEADGDAAVRDGPYWEMRADGRARLRPSADRIGASTQRSAPEGPEARFLDIDLDQGMVRSSDLCATLHYGQLVSGADAGAEPRHSLYANVRCRWSPDQGAWIPVD